MKRFFIIFVTVFITTQLTIQKLDCKTNTCYAVPKASSKLLNVKGEGVVLLDVKSGRVLYEQNARKRMYPASTTKILTALAAVENGSMDDNITVGSEISMIPEDASIAGLKVGERYKLKDLMMALMLPSGNDAANAVAVYIGRRVSNDSSLKIEDALNSFVKLMNRRSQEAGAMDSHFVNPHGYHDKEHYSTAYDISRIAREAMKSEFFREVVKTPLFEVKGGHGTYRWMNTNLLLNRNHQKYYYPFATGMKTGYTAEAGFCLVSSALKDGVELVSVVLNSQENSRFTDSRTIFEYGFTNYGYYKLISRNDIVKTLKITNGADEGLGVVAAGAIECLLSKSQSDRVEKVIKLDDNLFEQIEGNVETYKLKSSISKDQAIGKIIFSIDGSLLGEVELISERDFGRRSISLAAGRYIGFFDKYSYMFFILVVFGIAFCVAAAYRIIIIKRKR